MKVNYYSQASFAAQKSSSKTDTEPREIKSFDSQTNTVEIEQVSTACEIEDVIKSLFEPICKKFGLEYSKEFVFNNLITKINTKYTEESDINTLKRVALCIEKALEEHYDYKTKTLNLANAIETARLYDTASSASKSIEDIKNSECPKDIASVICTQYAKNHNGKNVDLSTLSAKKKKLYIKEYFESKLKEYCSKPNMSKEKAEELLLVDFHLLLKNTPDNKKYLLLDVAFNVFEQHKAIKLLFESFQGKNKATELANSIQLEDLKGNGLKSAEIVKNMSKQNIIKYLNEYDNNFKQLYKEKREIIDRVLDKISKGKALTEEELNVKKELDSYKELAVVLQVGTAENVNFSKEDKEDVQHQIDLIIRQYPEGFYNMYMKSLAEFISQNQNSLDTNIQELKEMLDKASNNKFSEEFKKIPEKSATDDSGKFKTTSEEVIVKSEEKIQVIKQSIEKASAPEPTVVEIKKNNSRTVNDSDTSIVNYETITGDNGSDIIKDIFTGKIKVSEYLEQVAIKKYKLMDTAMQGKILLNATGEFFNDLVQNLETSTFEHLLSIGWKGRCYAATQEVKDEVEERRDDVA